jgi:CHAT domain-containing protein
MRAMVLGLCAACWFGAAGAEAQTRREPDRARLEQLIATAKAIDIAADPKASLAAQQAALAEVRRIYPPGHPEVARHMARVGAAEAALGNYDAALALIEPAIPRLKGAGPAFATDYVDARTARGFVFNYRGDHARARTEFADIVADLRGQEAGKPSDGFATALSNLAASEFEAGNLDTALALNAEATAMGERVRPVPGDIAIWYANRIVYLYSSGRTEEAIAAARHGLARSEAVLPPDHPSLTNILANLGSLLMRQGRPNDALPILRRAFELGEKANGGANQNSAAVRVMFSQALIAAGRHEDAETFLESAQPILDAQLGAESDRALLARESRALALSRLGRHRQALEIQAAVLVSRDRRLPPAHRDRMFGRANLAKIAVAAGDLARARSALAEGVALRAAAVPPMHPDLLAERAMLLMVRSRSGEAAAAAAEARDVLARMAENASYRTEDVLTERERTAFGHLAEVLIRAGDAEHGFVAQQYAARTSVDDAVAAAAAQRSFAARPALAAALAERRKLAAARQALFAQVQAQLQKPAEGFDLPAMIRRIDQAGEQLRAADARIGGEALAILRFRPQSVAAARARLRAGDMFLMVSQLNDAIAVTALTRDARRQHMVADPQAAVAAVAAIRASLDPHDLSVPFDRARAAGLYRLLLPNAAEAMLRGKQRLFVSANGALAALPFGVLPDRQGRFLIDRAAVVRLAGAPHANASAAAASPMALVALGDVMTGAAPLGQVALRSGADARTIRDLPRLPQAAAELTELGASLGVARPVLLTGAEATEEALRKLVLPDGAILAFATHGLVSGELEGLREPALLLTPSGEDDGLLTASEISQLDLPALWVILSACNTAAAAGPDAPGLSGLAQAFILAGGRNILATHWPVRDDAARAISVATLRAAARGVEPAAALRGAIRQLRRDRGIPGSAHPALWAPFELVGS